jgi:hypothetical protein
MSTQPSEDLSTAIERAIGVCTEYGLVSSPEEFLRDFADEARVSALTQSDEDDVRAYGQVLKELREKAHDQALSSRPVPSMVEAGSGPVGAGVGEVSDGAYVEDEQEEEDLAKFAAKKAKYETPTPATKDPEPPADDEAMAQEIRDAIGAKAQDMLDMLMSVPVSHLRFPPVYAAQISSPAVTEQTKELVVRVIAPIMSACGIMSVEVTPSYYDPAKGEEVELDMSKSEDIVTYVRDALRR